MKTKQNQKSKFMEKGIRSVFTEDGVGGGGNGREMVKRYELQVIRTEILGR